MHRMTLVMLFTLAWTAGASENPMFVDRAAELGLDFVHFNGMSGKTYFPEMMGAGAAMLDYDGDGDLDLYLVQGSMLGPGRTLDQALFKPQHPLPLTDRLYRNLLVEKGRLQFEDVTDKAGIPTASYGMGVSVGDPNGDGRPDLYVTAMGSNRLLLNQGDGSFHDATTEAGVDDSRWSVHSAFFDYDRDGDDDLYIVNYVDFSFDNIKICGTFNDLEDYCSPQTFNPVTDRLYRNDGNGKFEDVSSRSGIAAARGHGLGLVVADFSGDGLADLYVANDGSANFMWINQGDGRFSDEALMAGASVNLAGRAEASMGVDAGDFDNDGDLDLFMTHMVRQTNTLYVNDGNGWFMDRTGTTGLGTTSFPFTGFGTRWFDYDNDGWLDLLSANGAVVKEEDQVQAGDILPLKLPNQIWRNNGKGDFVEVSELAGDGFTVPRVSRGAAFGDLDNDGDIDVLITNNAEAANLLINGVGQENSWIGIVPVWKSPQRIAVGVLAQFQFGERTTWHRSRTDGSYVSGHDPRIVAGLGDHRGQVKLDLTWPDGTRQSLELMPGRYHTVRHDAE